MKLKISEKYRQLKTSVLNEFKAKGQSKTKIALSLAFGCFMSFAPVWGFQTALTISLALLLRLNKVLALVTLNISSVPLLWPLIFYSSYQTGYMVLYQKFATIIPKVDNLGSLGNEVFTYALGAVIAGVVFALSFYCLVLAGFKVNSIIRRK